MVSFKPILGKEPIVTPTLAEEHGLTPDEYRKVQAFLGRVPTFTELGIYSVMWSEHCSYKNSIAMLKTLPRSGKGLLVGAGEENAGLVDIGDGYAIAFKIESHNHPSAVEPYQGAATGVGGILRDIFSMGARPIAALNSLRFGPLTDSRVRHLFKRIVKGIGDYGNSFGVPTVAGEVYFDPCYTGNPLVNAMAVGLVEHDHVAKASAPGAGNSVMIVGSSTGRDGIHGATFASEEISEASEARRPSVQVGDPFTEKLLLEATLEAIKTGFVVGIQDMGAAGITCSTSEMSAKAGTGMKIELNAVPLREGGMSAYEILLSESQERMLFIVKKGCEEEVNKVFRKWDLHAEVIGHVEGTGRLQFSVDGEEVANVPPRSLVLGGDAPVYQREIAEPEYLGRTRAWQTGNLKPNASVSVALMRLLANPDISSKRWVFEQYDSMVRTNTVMSDACDAAVIRIKEANKRIAVTTDCNGRYVYLNPRRGAMIAVAEAARNVTCVGARPTAITNCLNFGNPYDPEVYWQFREAVLGIGEACRLLGTPVTGGNVSFYNESPDAAVFPTPVIGMLGVFEPEATELGARFTSPEDCIILIGGHGKGLEGSTYAAMNEGFPVGDAPALDLAEERAMQEVILELNRKRIIKSAHDVSEGGLAVCIAESLLGTPGLGCDLDLSGIPGRTPEEILFSESQSRVVVTTSGENVVKAIEACKVAGVEAQELGYTKDSGKLREGQWLDLSVAELERIYESAIPALMASEL